METATPKKPRKRKPVVLDQAASAYKIVNNQDRSVLGEGRNWGMGFALCKMEGDTATTVMPISPCKDYLNDQIYSERTGKPYGAYGFNSEKRDIFKDGRGFMAISIMPQKYGREFKPYGNMEKDKEQLSNNYPAIQKFINWFEEKIKVNALTEIHKTGDNMYLVIFPEFWGGATYLISLYSLLIRAALKYKSGDPIAYLSKGADDSYYLTSALPKINRILAGEVPVQDWSVSSGIHNWGIVNYQFP